MGPFSPEKSAARRFAASAHADLDAVGLEQIGVIPRCHGVMTGQRQIQKALRIAVAAPRAAVIPDQMAAILLSRADSFIAA